VLPDRRLPLPVLGGLVPLRFLAACLLIPGRVAGLLGYFSVRLRPLVPAVLVEYLGDMLVALTG
jgi:hypothetical protein